MNRAYDTDRRRFQRLKVNLSVFYRLSEAPWRICEELGTNEYEATAVDLSESGMGLCGQHAFPQGVKLNLSFILNKCDDEGLISIKDPVEVKAMVCYSLPKEDGQYRLGLCFQEVTTREKYALANFIYSTRYPKTFL